MEGIAGLKWDVQAGSVTRWRRRVKFNIRIHA